VKNEHTDDSFTYTVKLTAGDVDTDLLEDSYILHYGNNEKEIEIGSDATFTLKADETAYILGLPEGVEYTFTESDGTYATTVDGASGNEFKGTIVGVDNKF